MVKLKIATLLRTNVIVSNEKSSNQLYSKGAIGTIKKAVLHLSLIEALFLIDQQKIVLYEKDEIILREQLIKKASKKDKRFYLKYLIYSDLKKKGYVVKTALKYGFDFRVYDKGSFPGKEHAIYLVICFNQNEKLNIIDFAKLMRISHSVRKKSLMAIADDEGDITYFENAWRKL